MRIRRVFWLSLGFFALTSSAIAQINSFLCVADNAVGFSFNKSTKNWERTNFKAERKYVLSKTSDKEMGWEVKEIGSSSGSECAGDFNELGFIDCTGLMDFQMNNKSLRYIIVHKYGYVVYGYPDDGPLKEGSLTPFMEIGKCSPL